MIGFDPIAAASRAALIAAVRLIFVLFVFVGRAKLYTTAQ